ncbi:MAG: adenosylcobinamide-GDP ribazoletransferase [Leptolyngbyaceae cyanobacterium SL_7_1]|nr:adenosylcobinamide-GDP ribazoletransferase [Leptolyngbyaceae cyanobacterium SL_7_1]
MVKPLGAALTFYTALPVPFAWGVDIQYAAQMAPTVGVLLGGCLGLLDWGLAAVGMPVLVGSVVVVLCWIGLTGGLHLDGAMDTADGLAVQDPSRRLEVMSDSATGAFGAMAAIALLLLKAVALSAIPEGREVGLVLAAGWGRWAQQVAIVHYPYLKPTGKGSFHKTALPSAWHLVPSGLLLAGISALPLGLQASPALAMKLAIGGAIAWVVPLWFARQLGGHTGDTYGAVVEWTEAIFLTVLTVS